MEQHSAGSVQEQPVPSSKTSQHLREHVERERRRVLHQRVSPSSRGRNTSRDKDYWAVKWPNVNGKDRVWKKLLNKMTGVTTGQVLRSFLGVAVPFSLVVIGRSALERLGALAIAAGWFAWAAIGWGIKGTYAAEDAETPGRYRTKQLRLSGRKLMVFWVQSNVCQGQRGTAN